MSYKLTEMCKQFGNILIFKIIVSCGGEMAKLTLLTTLLTTITSSRLMNWFFHHGQEEEHV